MLKFKYFKTILDRSYWYQPTTHGNVPNARQRHIAIGLPNQSLLIWGGIGGGNAPCILEVASMTWFDMKNQSEKSIYSSTVDGENVPTARWGHSAVVVGKKNSGMIRIFFCFSIF